MPYYIAKDGSAIDFTPSGDMDGWAPCTRKEHDAARKAAAIKRLATMLKPGDDVYPVMMHRSSSGMSRRYRVFLPIKRDARRLGIVDATRYVALACGYRMRDGELVVGGCGGSFDIVYSLGWSLWPKGTRKPHGTRNGKPDRDGGYALNDGRL